jgi:hypothetical protein
MTEASLGRPSSPSILSSVKRFACEHPFLFATGALILGGAIVAVAYKLLAAGDEPPIRVKKGSMYLELLTDADEKWEPETPTSPNWKISKGTRSKDDLRVVVVTTGSHTGCQNQPATARSAELTYTEGTNIYKVRLQSTQKHLLILPLGGKRFTQEDDRNLKYEVQAGYISKIVVGQGSGEWKCNFAADQLEGIFVLDW